MDVRLLESIYCFFWFGYFIKWVVLPHPHHYKLNISSVSWSIMWGSIYIYPINEKQMQFSILNGGINSM